MRRLILPLLCLYTFSTIHSVQAREPGIGPVFPPGLTLGLPIAVNPPPGLYLMNRLSWSDFQVKDGHSHNIGQKNAILADSLQLTWVPGINVFGASYKAFVMVPFVDITMKRTSTATGPLGSWHTHGIANPKLQPFDLSWRLNEHWHIGTGLGFYAPLGKYNKDAALNLAGNYWTLEPSIGITYLDGKWHFSSQVGYNTNTRNPDNKYRSGDQLFVNNTLTYNVGGWDVGPVGYFMRQVTEDSNRGGMATFGGQTFPKQEQAGLGILVGGKIASARVATYYTQDIYTHNTAGGGKLWLNVLIPLS